MGSGDAGAMGTGDRRAVGSGGRGAVGGYGTTLPGDEIMVARIGSWFFLARVMKR
jgi:hypothetical protein